MSAAALDPAFFAGGLAFVRLAPLAVWWARASAGFLPPAVAWATAMALACFFGAGAHIPSIAPGYGPLLVLLLQELATGVVTCFVLAAPFVALRFALGALGQAVGGSLGPLLPRVFGLGACALLMHLAVHRALVRALAESFVGVPLGMATIDVGKLSLALFALFAHASGVCLTLLMPWLCALLVLDLAVALGTRFFGAEGTHVAHVPVRVAVLALALGTAWLSFAERFPLLLRGGFSLLLGMLKRVAP